MGFVKRNRKKVVISDRLYREGFLQRKQTFFEIAIDHPERCATVGTGESSERFESGECRIKNLQKSSCQSEKLLLDY
jgi:hypothetical protein